MNIKRVVAASAATAIVLLLGATPALADFTTVHVYAYGVFVDYTDGGPVGLGPVPVEGPFNTDTNFVYDERLAIDSPKVTTGYSSAAVEAHAAGLGGGFVWAEAKAQNVSAVAGTVTGEVYSGCDIHRQGVDYVARGFGLTIGLVVNGVPVPEGLRPPNTVIPVVSDAFTGTVTLNEQTYDPLTNTIFITAIHMHAIGGTAGTGDIFIGHVECGGLAAPDVVIPESPVAVLIPLIGLAAIAGAWYLRRNPITRASN
jgi:hypothetical protein